MWTAGLVFLTALIVCSILGKKISRIFVYGHDFSMAAIGLVLMIRYRTFLDEGLLITCILLILYGCVPGGFLIYREIKKLLPEKPLGTDQPAAEPLQAEETTTADRTQEQPAAEPLQAEETTAADRTQEQPAAELLQAEDTSAESQDEEVPVENQAEEAAEMNRTEDEAAVNLAEEAAEMLRVSEADETEQPLMIKWGICFLAALLFTFETASFYQRMVNHRVADVVLFLGVVFIVAGLALETAADLQKYVLSKRESGSFSFASVYRLVRYPHWCGMLLFSTGLFVSGLNTNRGSVQWAAAVLGYAGIVYAIFSGVRRTEIKDNLAFGREPAYQEYVRSTPVLIPFVRLYSVAKYKWLAG